MKFTHAKAFILTGILAVLTNFSAYGGTILESSKINMSGSLTFKEAAKIGGTIVQNGTLSSGYLKKGVELAEVKMTPNDSKTYIAIKWQTPADDNNANSLIRNIYEVSDVEKKYPLAVEIQRSPVNLEQLGDWVYSLIPGYFITGITSAQEQYVKPGVYNFEILSSGWYNN